MLNRLETIINEIFNLSEKTLYSLASSGRAEIHDEKVIDISTEGDRSVSNQIVTYFEKKRYPVVLLSEESGKVELSVNPLYTVVVDDIDGSDNYFRGDGLLPYCTVITFFKESSFGFKDICAAGVIEHIRGKRFIALRGAGAWEVDANGQLLRKLSVSGRKLIDRRTLVVVDHYSAKNKIDALASLYPACWIKDFGSSAFHFMGVASGMFDGFVNCANKSHEFGAGYLLCTEAGGVVQSFDGTSYEDKEFIFEDTYDIVASATLELTSFIRECICWT